MNALDRLAFASAGAVCLAVSASLWLGLPDPWWSAISALIVAHPDRGAVLSKSVMRFIGTLAGAGIGFLVATQVEGAPTLQLAAVFAATAFAMFAKLRFRYAYAWMMAALMVVIMLYMSMVSPADLYGFAHDRVLEILIGVLFATGVNRLVSRAEPKRSQAPGAAPGAAAGADRPEAVRWALIAGSTAVAIPIVWSTFELPSLVQIGVTVLVVLDRETAAARERGLQRLYGCLLGGLLGLLMVPLPGDSYLLWLGGLFVGTFLFLRLHLSRSRWAYVGTQAAIALALCAITGNGPTDTILPVLNRLAGILCGVTILVVVTWVVDGLLAASRRDRSPAT